MAHTVRNEITTQKAPHSDAIRLDGDSPPAPPLLLAALLMVVHPNEFALQSSLAGTGCPDGAGGISVAAHHVVAQAAPDFRLLMGVLTLPSRYERRHLLRTVYALQQPNLMARVDVRFFFCRIESDEQRLLVALEAMRYGRRRITARRGI